MKKNQVIICRCEDITEDEIRACIREHGFTTINEIRKLLRAGMGMCQGRTCQSLIARILAEETGRTVDQISLPTVRQPAKPVEFEIFLKEEK
ncbi:MAG: (2Fe-2S)-binding protein [Candidatus Wallbacteria bacterium]|nr:(2Fe-2S)-binding protein [Candidatus Wallbacteria bacterium]